MLTRVNPLLLLFICLLGTNFSRAQTPLADASKELRHMFSACVNPNPDVRFFYNMAAHITDSNYFQRYVSTDTNDVNNWYRIYEEMGYMAYDTTTWQADDSVFRMADVHIRVDTFPLAIMDFKYNLLKPGVLDTNIWFDFDTVTNILSDQPGRPSSPYEPVQNVFNCAPLERSYEFNNPVFMVDPRFIFTDPPPPGCNTCSKLQGTLKVDFSDGTGWHIFSADSVSYYRPLYSSTGEKLIHFTLDSAGITIKYSKAIFRITKNTPLIAADETWMLPGMKVSLFNGCGSGTQQKFVIYLEGLDVLENRTGPSIYHDMIEVEHIDELRNLGYSFLVVDWSFSYRDIRQNAMSLVGLIDTLKLRYPSLPPLVVIGESMSGLVGRYALRWMETNNYLYDQTHPQLAKMHNTRLFITIDAPHRGANIPLAYQWFYRYAQTNFFGKTFVQPLLFHKLMHFYAPLLNRPSTKQMLLYHINSDPSWILPISAVAYGPASDKGEFDADLMALGNDGFPEYCKKVALSNGSWMGNRQARTWDDGYRVANDEFLNAGLESMISILGHKVAGSDASLIMRSNPDGNGDVFECNYGVNHYAIKLKRWGVKIGLSRDAILGVKKRALNSRPYCVSPGSNQDMKGLFDKTPDNDINFDVIGMLGFEYQSGIRGLKLSTHFGLPLGILRISSSLGANSDGPDFGFIPTGSSFAYTDFETAPLDDSLMKLSPADLLDKTPFDVVVSNPTNHVEFTPYKGFFGNRFHLFVENPFFNEFNSCYVSGVRTTVNSFLINREIGDDTLYLENTKGLIDFNIEAYRGLFVNHKNPHYNYPDPADIAQYGNYIYHSTGNNNGHIAFSKDGPYEVLGASHTFHSNDTFAQNDLYTWQYNYIPGSIIPCCIDFSKLVRKVPTQDSGLFAGEAPSLFRLYPNPINGGQKLRLIYSFAQQGAPTVSIYNTLGQKVWQEKLPTTESEKIYHSDLSLKLETGLYILRLRNGNQQYQTKIIINP